MPSPRRASSTDTAAAAADGFVFGYPLVLMSRRHEWMTSVQEPDPQRMLAPPNRFVHARALPEALAGRPAGPRAGTLRSSAWLDLGGGPILLEHPIQLTIAATDGERIWAFRYSSAGRSRSLFVTTDVPALRRLYPSMAPLERLSDDTHLVVSEPLSSARSVARGAGGQLRGHRGRRRGDRAVRAAAELTRAPPDPRGGIAAGMTRAVPGDVTRDRRGNAVRDR